MGWFSRKKKDDTNNFDLGAPKLALRQDMELPPYEENYPTPLEQQRNWRENPQTYAQNQFTPQQFQQPQQQQTQSRQEIIEKDIQIVNSKIDALKAGVDALNQRLANIENLLQSKANEPKKPYW